MAEPESEPDPKPKYDFSDFALTGHFITVTLLTKLVDKRLISPADAIDLLDDVLLQLEEHQARFPDHQPYFASARVAVSESLDVYRAMLKAQPD
jgi:hypothetical protein